MYLRKLLKKDAPFMLEWMHDSTVVKYLRTDFESKTIIDAENFIYAANDTSNRDIHYAICSDEDEYMGTVSLKRKASVCSAEFAITVRKRAMGHGYSWFGMKEIIRKAFEEYGLESVYWCVSLENKRAVRFYDKHYFHEAYDIPSEILADYKGITNLKWYSVLKGDVIDGKKEFSCCKIIRIKTIPTVDSGELSFFESRKDVPFEIKRIYYISKVPEGIRRGFHAHKQLKQLLICPYGRIQLLLENKKGREEIELSDPSVGILIEEPTWREMVWLQKDSVLCVAASEYYSAEDYVRSYDEFKKLYLS